MIEGVADGDALTSTTAATTTCRAGGSSLLDPADGERPRDALELGTRPVGEVLVPLARMSTVDHRVTPRPAGKGRRRRRLLPNARLGPGEHDHGLPAHQGRHRRIRRASPSPAPPCIPRPATRVQIDTPLDDALTAMRSNGTHLAAVTGDKGTVIGFVTMEDVLSELVGPTPA